MKLTPEQLQFIDNYLTNSGVFYLDIRMEMMDHVASAVERKMQAENLDFYDAFKDFMVQNKKELMKNNREGFGYQDTKTFKEGFRFLMKPWSLVSLPIILFMFYFWVDEINRANFHSYYLGFVALIALSWGLGIYIYKKTYLKGARFFVLEQSEIFFVIIFQIMNPFLMNQKVMDASNFWLYGLFFYFMMNAMAFQIYNLKLHQKKLLMMVS